ncbi:hypothetical protein [Pseudomonas fluorescens]
MDKFEIRKANLQTLIDRVYGEGVWGAKAKFAKRLEKQPDYLSRLLYPKGKPGAKNVGEDLAREIEREFDLPQYSMDMPGLSFDQGPEEDFPMAEVVVRPRYLDQNYEKAAPGLRRIADEIANRILQMPEDRALKLKQAIELLVPADDVKN